MLGSLVRNVLLLAASCVLAVALAEGGLRIAGDHALSSSEYIMVGDILNPGDPVLGFSMVPGSSRIAVKGGAYLVHDRISSLGLRDVEHSIRRQPGTRRILVLGDSYMFGEGVRMEHTMPRLLAELMPGVDVINAGVQAYDLGQEYLYYKHHGRDFKPNLVLLAFFSNDLVPERFLDVESDPGGLPVAYRSKPAFLRKKRDEAPRGVSAWLRSYSVLYVLARKRLDDLVAGHPRSRGSPREDPATWPILGAYASHPTSTETEAWRRAYLILDDLKRLVTLEGSDLAIIIVPAPWQTSEQEWRSWLAPVAIEPESLSRRKPVEMVSSWCERTSTLCLDLLPDFERADCRRSYFWPYDMHWTVEGHRLAAHLVSAFLSAHHLP